ncbi:DUF4139 domain-containing protein [Panacibacter sp. DH6]|uniref:DUF4139 domain-containing protein n=1 Tax=Panacibacter microcysteis TaxID=2793269 RepID=A0A931E9M6_9BACT|nr:DUF4139 domain-containing protein [Panacibacter microcysteis]
MTKSILLLVVSTVIFLKAFSTDGNIVQANLKTVKVYRTGAELTHATTALLTQGTNQLLVDNLANNIDLNSLQIKVPSSVTIVGLEFSTNYKKNEEKTPRQEMLEDSLVNIRRQIEKLNLQIDNDVNLLEVLSANKEIKGQQNGLSVTELAKLMDYYQTKSFELSSAVATFREKKEKLATLLNKIENQVDEEAKKNVNTSGRLAIQVNAAVTLKAEFIISYVASNAYWIPYYDVKVENVQQAAKLFYKAKIVQTTGLDWKQVKLSLSTSVPALKGVAPKLDSWFVGYVTNNAPIKLRGLSTFNDQALQGSVAGLNIGSASQLSEVVVVGYGRAGDGDAERVSNDVVPKPVYILNGNIINDEEFKRINPNSIKNLKVLKPKEASNIYGGVASGGATVVDLKTELSDYVSVNNTALNVNFEIDIPYDIPTNGKAQTATLQTVEIPLSYEHIAAPRKDADVYLTAKLVDWEKLNLLQGEANIILEGTYIGKTMIEPNTSTDTMQLTLGRDKRVIVQRQKLADFSSVKFLGSNKLQKFTYEIMMKNNNSEQVFLKLNDQFPLSTDKDIEVELLDSGNADINNETGLLKWDITLLPGESKKVRFSYSIRYAKDRTINTN